MITPELKDKLLEHIVNNANDMFFKGSEEDLAVAMECGAGEILEILHQFNRKGLVQPVEHQIEESLGLYVRADAHDYILKGGHVGEFMVMELQLQKLQSELLALEKQFGREPFRDLATAANTLTSFFQAFYHR